MNEIMSLVQAVEALGALPALAALLRAVLTGADQNDARVRLEALAAHAALRAKPKLPSFGE